MTEPKKKHVQLEQRFAAITKVEANAVVAGQNKKKKQWLPFTPSGKAKLVLESS